MSATGASWQQVAHHGNILKIRPYIQRPYLPHNHLYDATPDSVNPQLDNWWQGVESLWLCPREVATLVAPLTHFILKKKIASDMRTFD